jgi:hypothetical protein
MTMTEIHEPPANAPAVRPQQRDLFEPAVPRGRQVIRGRIKLFPRKPKPSGDADQRPFDDPLPSFEPLPCSAASEREA